YPGRSLATEGPVAVVVATHLVDDRTVHIEDGQPVFRIVAYAFDHQELVDAVAVGRHHLMHTDGQVGIGVHHPYGNRYRLGRLVVAVARLRGRDVHRTQPQDV